MTIRIAVAQMETIPGDVQHNRSRALALAGEGLKQQAHIILFPEGMITGYCDRFEELAEPADGPTAQAFRSLLKGSSTVVLFGLVEREDSRSRRKLCFEGMPTALAVQFTRFGRAAASSCHFVRLARRAKHPARTARRPICAWDL